jgi:hypothetical protein
VTAAKKARAVFCVIVEGTVRSPRANAMAAQTSLWGAADRMASCTSARTSFHGAAATTWSALFGASRRRSAIAVHAASIWDAAARRVSAGEMISFGTPDERRENGGMAIASDG